MNGKRSHQEDGPESETKRIRANDGSPAPASPGAGRPADGAKDAMAKKIAALKAKMTAQRQGETVAAPVTAPVAPPVAPPVLPDRTASGTLLKADVNEKIAALKAKLARNNRAALDSRPAPSPSIQQSQIAEVHARVAAIAAKRAETNGAATIPSSREDGRGARGGLGVGLHPSLLADTTTQQTKGKTGPKFSTTKGNQQPAKPKVNPYLAAGDQVPKDDANPSYDPSLASRKGVVRHSKQLIFNQKGKFMAQANALRQQAKLEEMKRRIAADTRKAEIEQASDKSFLVPEPSNVEWWDEGLLPENQDSYQDWQESGRNRIKTSETVVTALIQRPVLLQAPQDKLIPEPKPLMLTPKEQKKVRRQRRMADMKEEQAKIRLGLVEPPPPKVKKSNMMRVLGEQAVKDPTAVEARVNREIAQRAADHEQDNQDRMLTKEQRAEKLKNQQAGDEAKGVKIAVFKVNDLSSGKHRYQVDINAKQNGLTGVVVLNPEMNLVIVEGGNHSISAYKKLMLKRIRWTENTAPLEESQPTTFTGTTDGSNANPTTGIRSSGSKATEWCNPLDDQGNLKDLSANGCVLVWEGDEPARSFKRWGSRACETDGEARDVLSRQKMENMWTLARTK